MLVVEKPKRDQFLKSLTNHKTVTFFFHNLGLFFFIYHTVNFINVFIFAFTV